MRNFADDLLRAVEEKRNPSVIGLDPDIAKMPVFLRKESEKRRGGGFDSAADCILRFNQGIIDSVKDVVPAVKLQSAFYEQLGPAGMKAFLETAKYAKSKGLIVIGDVKRSDIGNTAAAYSNAYLGEVPLSLSGAAKPCYGLDAVTVNPYLGSDGIMPFIEDCRLYGKGIFILVKTSNPSSRDVQDRATKDERVYEAVARLVDRLGDGLVGKKGYSSVGAVVGATYPTEAAELRKRMPAAIFLVPGYGAQGAGAKDIMPCFREDGTGALIHSARAVIYAYQGWDDERRFGEAARNAAVQMKQDISEALEQKGIYPW